MKIERWDHAWRWEYWHENWEVRPCLEVRVFAWKLRGEGWGQWGYERWDHAWRWEYWHENWEVRAEQCRVWGWDHAWRWEYWHKNWEVRSCLEVRVLAWKLRGEVMLGGESIGIKLRGETILGGESISMRNWEVRSCLEVRVLAWKLRGETMLGGESIGIEIERWGHAWRWEYWHENWEVSAE